MKVRCVELHRNAPTAAADWRPTGNDYWMDGDPWIIICPEHAEILKAGGLSKSEVKRRLWEASKMPAGRLAAIDMRRTQIVRRAELGILSPETMVPICSAPERLGIIVCGGRGTLFTCRALAIRAR